MTTEDLLGLIASAIGHPPEPASGGFLYCHTPHMGQFAYLARVYDPVSSESVRNWAKTGLNLRHPYFTFLTEVANGVRIANINLYGLIERVDRSVGPHVGQPISLDYGNIVERPINLELDDLVIGSMVGWSSRGVFVMKRDGGLRLVHYLDCSDVAAEWPDLKAMLRAETKRVSGLHDAQGREIAPATQQMHPGGRRWEESIEPERSIHCATRRWP